MRAPNRVLAVLAAALALGGCMGKEPSDLAPAKGGPKTAVYQEPGGLFSCEVPAAWRVLENQGGAQKVSFFGPPDGEKPFSASISFYYYGPGSNYAGPRDYAAAQAASGGASSPPIEKDLGGRKTLQWSSLRKRPVPHSTAITEETEDTVLIPMKSGFLAVVHAAATAAHPKTEASFKALLASLRIP